MALISTPGLYDLSAAEYHADPCEQPSLSASIGKIIVGQSPLHARCRHPRFGGFSRDPSATMEYGDVAHQLLLGKGRGLAVIDADDWRKKDAQNLREEARVSGLTPILLKKKMQADDMVAAIKDQLAALDLAYIFEEGESEKVAIWQEGDRWCRSMMDRLILSKGEIWDLKTTEGSAHPDQCGKRIRNEHMDLQAEFYIRGIEALHPDLAGIIKFRFLFAEDKPPFAITPYEMDGAGRTIGQVHVDRAIKTWDRCLSTGIWPGYTNGIYYGETPTWAINQEMNNDTDI